MTFIMIMISNIDDADIPNTIQVVAGWRNSGCCIRRFVRVSLQLRRLHRESQVWRTQRTGKAKGCRGEQKSAEK